MTLNQGDIVPLTLQLFDNDEEQRVRARVVSESGAVFFDGELSSAGLGLYQDTSLKMPDNVAFLAATYIVTGSDKYASAGDIFVLNTYPAPVTLEDLNQIKSSESEYFSGQVVQELCDDYYEARVGE